MKKLKTIILLTLMVFTLTNCGHRKIKNTADKQMQKQTAQQMEEANKQIGMPAIKNFQERKLMKMILELRDDEKLICYAYLYNRNTGTVGQFLGKCLGFGLPYSVQYTNPQKLVDVTDFGIRSYQANDAAVVPQADPNGLFMPTGLSATWLMLLDDKGKPHPCYIEPEIMVFPFPLKKSNK